MVINHQVEVFLELYVLLADQKHLTVLNPETSNHPQLDPPACVSSFSVEIASHAGFDRFALFCIVLFCVGLCMLEYRFSVKGNGKKAVALCHG